MSADDPPRFMPRLCDCRIGDWQQAGLVFEWWGRGERQEYQPEAPEPFDPATFSAMHPVRVFERCPHPFEKFPMGQPCHIWKRVA